MKKNVIGTAGTAPMDVISSKPYSIHLESKTQIIVISAGGFWNLTETEEYIKAITPLIQSQRARLGIVKVLVDRRGSAVFSQVVSQRFERFNRELFSSQDRIAFVLSKALLKSQLRRVLSPENHRLFIDTETAKGWLSSH
jgi:hypothetical protein